MSRCSLSCFLCHLVTGFFFLEFQALVLIHRFFSVSLILFFMLWYSSSPGYSLPNLKVRQEFHDKDVLVCITSNLFCFSWYLSLIILPLLGFGFHVLYYRRRAKGGGYSSQSTVFRRLDGQWMVLCLCQDWLVPLGMLVFILCADLLVISFAFIYCFIF